MLDVVVNSSIFQFVYKHVIQKKHHRPRIITDEELAYERFKEQLLWRERKYGKPLSVLQKIKAARAISHEVYPTDIYRGRRGHWIREEYRNKLLKSIGIHYRMK